MLKTLALLRERVNVLRDATKFALSTDDVMVKKEDSHIWVSHPTLDGSRLTITKRCAIAESRIATNSEPRVAPKVVIHQLQLASMAVLMQDMCENSIRCVTSNEP
ncbi:hypothetical protein J6590_003420 [Homalodisca vitripennis]|nr:hypothetical protein J6590_003420 [Homalodisca vitripennis]